MTAGWFTSAALVGLIVATILFVWQRKVEHQFLLRKEKRELFAKIIKQSEILFADLVNGKMDDPGYLSESQNHLEALHFLSILELYDSAGVYKCFRDLMAQYRVEVSRGVRPGLSPQQLLMEISEKKDLLLKEMQADLKDTVVVFPFQKRKRFRFRP